MSKWGRMGALGTWVHGRLRAHGCMGRSDAWVHETHWCMSAWDTWAHGRTCWALQLLHVPLPC